MFNILDAVIIILLLGGIVFGLKRGFLRETTMFIGTIVIIVLAYFLKNPVADILFSLFPFIDFKDFASGGVLINILFFETIAFVIVFCILLILFRVLVNTSKVIEKIFNATIILGIISKILGAVVGFIHYYIITFILLFIVSIPLFNFDFSTSKFADKILYDTPILSNIMKDSTSSINEIKIIENTIKNNKNKNEYNASIVDYMLKGKVITVHTADNLVKQNKLNYTGIGAVIDKYRE